MPSLAEWPTDAPCVDCGKRTPGLLFGNRCEMCRIARERPNSTVIALTPNAATARRLTLVWGVHSVVTKDASDIDDMAFRACKFSVREGFAKEGDRLIVVAGVPFGTPGATNMVRIAFVAKEHVEQA